MEESVDRPLTHRMPLRLQGHCQLRRTLACPPQERHRVATGHRIDQGFQGTDEVRIMRTQRLTSPARTAYPLHRSLWVRRRDREGEFLQAGPYGSAGQLGRLGHVTDPPSSNGAGFHRRPEAACAFIQERTQDGKLRCDGLCDWVLHRAKHNILMGAMAKLFWRASLWRLGGIIVTAATYGAARPGGSYIIAWGAILFGA